jgi:uncharacterized protein (DUF2147 family)
VAPGAPALRTGCAAGRPSAAPSLACFERNLPPLPRHRFVGVQRPNARSITLDKEMTMHKIISILALAVGGMAGIASSSALAQTSPVGLWKTLADDGSTAKSLVRVSDSGGSLAGRIEKLLDPAQQDARCDKCSGARQGQPLKGLTPFDDARPDGGEGWSGGEILDPNTGKLHKLKFKPIDGGRKMELRVYAGPLFRTQTWIRVE